MEYASFLRRAVARVVDHTVIMALIIPIVYIAQRSGGDDQVIVVVSLYLFPPAYSSFFLGKFQATPGKMLCRMKVVQSNGRRLTEMRALGRGCAELLSGLMFFGYLLALADPEECRTLHDRLADTRVVLK